MAAGCMERVAVQLLNQLNEFRTTNGKYCDLKILVENRRYMCHRTVLAASCPFFNGMFGDGENSQDVISLDNVGAPIFDEILGFIYTGRANLTVENSLELLKTSNKWSLKLLENECVQFIRRNFLLKNLLEICKFAVLSIKDASFVDLMVFRAAKHLQALAKEKEFAEMEFDLFEKILKTKQVQILNACTEENKSQCVCRTSKKFQRPGQRFIPCSSPYCVNKPYTSKRRVVDDHDEREKMKKESLEILPLIKMWILKDRESRMKYLARLSEFTNLDLIGVSKFVDTITNYISVMKDDFKPTPSVYWKCEDGIDVAQWKREGRWEKQKKIAMNCDNFSVCGVSKKRFFVTYSNLMDGESCNTFWRYDENEVLTALQLPPVRVSDWRMAPVSNTMYLYDATAGSNRRYEPLSCVDFLKEKIPNSVYSYVVDLDKWMAIPTIPQMTQHSYFVSSGQAVYVIGNSTGSSVVQCYDPRTYKWTKQSFDVKFTMNGAAAFHDDKVYLCESLNLNDSISEKVSAFYVFDLVAYKWMLTNGIDKTDNLPKTMVPFENNLWLFSKDPKKMGVIYDPKGSSFQNIVPIEDPTIDVVSDVFDVVVF